VDERIEADHGIEGGDREADLGGVGEEKAGPRNKPAGPLDLHGAQVDAGDHVAAGGQVTGHRHATATAQIQDGPAGRDPFPEPRQPGGVVLRFRGIAPVAVGQGVVATTNDVLRIHRLTGLRGSLRWVCWRVRAPAGLQPRPDPDGVPLEAELRHHGAIEAEAECEGG
jgi:hypothetical protein